MSTLPSQSRMHRTLSSIDQMSAVACGLISRLSPSLAITTTSPKKVSALMKLCICRLCTAESPEGRMITSQLFSRHKKAQAIATSALRLSLAERRVAAETISQIAPAILDGSVDQETASMVGVELTGAAAAEGGVTGQGQGEIG